MLGRGQVFDVSTYDLAHEHDIRPLVLDTLLTYLELEGYFESGVLAQEDLEAGLRRAVAQRQIFPLTISASAHGIGTSALLDSLLEFIPSPTQSTCFTPR